MQEYSRSAPEAGQTQAKNISEGEGREAVYEIGFHLVPVLTEQEIAEAFDRLHKALARAKAAILAEESPKKMPLAYRIERSVAGKREKYTEGYFGFIKFELPEADDAGTHAAAFEQMLRGDSAVLRYLFIKTSREAPAAPKALYSSKSLEGRTIEKHSALPEERVEVSEEELDKSIEALVGEDTPQ